MVTGEIILLVVSAALLMVFALWLMIIDKANGAPLLGLVVSTCVFMGVWMSRQEREYTAGEAIVKLINHEIVYDTLAMDKNGRILKISVKKLDNGK